MNIHQIRLNNTRLIIHEVGSPAELARLSGTDPSYISQCFSDIIKKNIGDKVARRFESAAGKPNGWLDVPHDIGNRSPSKKKTYAFLKMMDVPKWLEDMSATHETIEWGFGDENASENSFVVEITTDAMVDSDSYSRSLGSGDMALIDPDAIPQHKDIVLVQLSPIDVRIREYQEDGAHKTLIAYEPKTTKPITLSSDMKILGVVISQYRKRKTIFSRKSDC